MYWILLPLALYIILKGSADSTLPNQGYIQMYYSGRYGSVCAFPTENWYFGLCSVVCRNLNYRFCFKWQKYDYEPGEVFVLGQLKCDGYENDIRECIHDGIGNGSFCHERLDMAGVICTDEILDIRLVNGKVPNEGQVELFYDGIWRSVCYKKWDILDADVACRQSGYGTAIEAVTDTRFGIGNNLILVKWFECKGSESALSECMHGGFKRSGDCNGSTLASVVCSDLSGLDLFPFGEILQLVGGIISEQLDELEGLEDDGIKYLKNKDEAVGVLLKSSNPVVELTPITTDPGGIEFSLVAENKNESIGIIAIVLRWQNLTTSSSGNELTSSFIASDLVSIVVYDAEGNYISKVNTTILYPPIQHTIPENNDTLWPVCVFINETSSPPKWSTEDCYTRYNDFRTQGVTCLSNHLTSFAILMQTKKGDVKRESDQLGVEVITYVGLSVSTGFLLFTLGIISGLSELRKSRRYKILRNTVISLLCTNFCFCVIAINIKNKIACFLGAACLHYCLLVAFTWMTIMSTDMYLCIQHAFLDPERRILFFRIFGWLFPLLIVVITVAVTGKNYASPESCWLNVDNGVTWSFIGPFILSISVVTIQLSIIGYVVYTKTQTPHQSDEEKNKLKHIRSMLYRILLLTPVVGLTWIFGILILLDSNIILQYLFVLSTSIQGFLIWFTQCFLSKEVNEAWKKFHNQHVMSNIVDVSAYTTET